MNTQLFSIESEAAVLGSMILSPDCINDVAELIDADHFCLGEGCDKVDMGLIGGNRTIYLAICEVYSRGEFDIVILRDQLKSTNELEKVGGVDYLKKLVGSVPSAANALYYAKAMVECTHQRRLIDFAHKATLIAEGLGKATDKSAQIQTLAMNLDMDETSSEIVHVNIDAMARVHENIITPSRGISWGFDNLDWCCQGMVGGDYIVIAGRPSMGKTQLAIDIAKPVAVSGKRVAIVSLEMHPDKVLERLVFGEAGVDSNEIRRDGVSEEIDKRLAEAGSVIANIPNLDIIDLPRATPSLIEAKVKRMHSIKPIDLVVIDYIQLIHIDGFRGNEQHELTIISNRLKALARELQVPFIIVAQLNRGNVDRACTRPRMSDIRGSGSIEQDADIIVLVHREDYYHKGESDYPKTGIADIEFAKNRMGATGHTQLIFRDVYCRFENI